MKSRLKRVEKKRLKVTVGFIYQLLIGKSSYFSLGSIGLTAFLFDLISKFIMIGYLSENWNNASKTLFGKELFNVG